MYERLGVDPEKTIVRQSFKDIINNEYPWAFVNIITDPTNKRRVVTQHQDGDGSKFIQRLLHYYEFGDDTVFEGMVDDALSMNAGDISASGFVFGPWLMSDVLNLNLDGELKEVILRAVSRRFTYLIDLYYQRGFDIKFLGGETADLRDQVRSGVFDIAIMAWAKKFEVVTGNVKPGDIIFGLLSDGRAIWETHRNSGIMSNGLTLSRSCLMDKSFDEKYPTLKRDGEFFKGRFQPNDCPDILGGMSVGEAILSPTRQWAFIIREIIVELKAKDALHMLHGISMNTGGGVTKISHVGNNVCYIKRMPTPPPIFQLIQQESGEIWEDMYRDFNCGVGIDIVGENNPILRQAIEIATDSCGINFKQLGKVISSSGAKPGNEVILQTPYGDFHY
ncbi:MAG: hypothetical protein WCT50_00600 [Patescibacteria group bacterium]